MKFRSAPLVAAALLFAGSAALADTAPVGNPDSGASSVSAARQKKAVDPNVDDSAVVCKREETTGSRLGATKECHTRAEWNARADAARSQVNNWQNQANVTAPH